MNVEIGAEAALFTEKEYMYISGIFVAVYTLCAFGHLLGGYVWCRLRRALTANLFCRRASFMIFI
jgi:hypothetical protein